VRGKKERRETESKRGRIEEDLALTEFPRQERVTSWSFEPWTQLKKDELYSTRTVSEFENEKREE